METIDTSTINMDKRTTSNKVNIPVIQIAKCRYSGMQLNHHPLRSSPEHGIQRQTIEVKFKFHSGSQHSIRTFNQNLRQLPCFSFTRTLHSHKTWARTTSEYWAIKFQREANCRRHGRHQKHKTLRS